MTFIPSKIAVEMECADNALAARLSNRERGFDEREERAAIDAVDAKLHRMAMQENADGILPAVRGQIEMLPRMLTGSQAKTAFALRMNAERMIKEGGLNQTGFLTLTVGDIGRDGKFQQVFDAKEASRRINNLNRRLLSDLFSRAIIVTERHKNGAIHFHVLGILKNGANIRTGFDFEAVKARDYRSVTVALREIWAMLREKLPNYGFGRAELTPVRKTGEAVAAYVSKYIEKNVCNRQADDKHKKLVRYLGWDKAQLKPNEFSWAGPKACAWRAKARALSRLVNVETREDAAACLGPRWAWKLTNLWRSTMGDDLFHGFLWDFREREFLRAQMVNENRVWAQKLENRKRNFDFHEWTEFRAGFPPQVRQPNQKPALQYEYIRSWNAQIQE